MNGVTTRYHLDDDKVMHKTNGTDKIYYTYDANGDLVSMNLNGTEYYYVYDGQGDVTGLIDNTGTEVVSYTYDTWGKLLSTTGTLASTVGEKNPYKYRAYRYDTETGLYYLQSRYYNPEWGRFINADDTSVLQSSQGDLLGYNLFAYCGNNPIARMDSAGYVWGNYWWNSRRFVSWAIDTVIVIFIDKSIGLAKSYFKKQIIRYGTKRAAILFSNILRKSLLKRYLGSKLCSIVINAIPYVYGFFAKTLNPGDSLFKYLDSKDKRPNNGYINW